MPDTFTAHDVPDLLNALPTLFGFRPTESLVAVATHGARHRFGFRMRVDIPASERVEALAPLVARHLRHQQAEGAVLVAVTMHQDVAAPLLAAVQSHLSDVEVVMAVRADGSRYWVDMPGFPADGVAYDVCDHHLSIVKAVAAGQQILPDREALAARFAPAKGPRRKAMAQLTVAAQLELARADDPVRRALDQLPTLLERTRGVITDEDAAQLSVWVAHLRVRDEVWRRINRESAPEMLQLLTAVSGAVVPPFEPAVLSLAAFAAWLTGDGAQALMAVERALTADPGYSMAQGILGLLEGGVSPAHWDS